MQFSRVTIAGLACVDAPEVFTSAELEQAILPTLTRIGASPGLIETLTGVVERRFFPVGVMPSDAATLAARAVIDQTGIDPSSIDLLINTSVCKDFIEPSVASTVHGNLGLNPACLNFDVGNACLAFLNAMTIAGNMIERGQIDVAMIVDGEDSRLPVETTIKELQKPSADDQAIRDHFATLTLGSGAAAMILTRGESNAPRRFVGGVSVAATQHNGLCRGQRDRMKTDASALLSAGVELAQLTYVAAQDQLGWTQDQLDEIVMHQVGAIHANTILKTLELDADKAHFIFPNYGNIGPAAIPITLKKAWDAGRLFDGDRVALMGIGSGLNCSMMEVVW